jgi:hypothetical protein
VSGSALVEYEAPAPLPTLKSQGERCRMMSDPRTVERLLGYMSKAVWLIMAYSFGTMVGRLILLARAG